MLGEFEEKVLLAVLRLDHDAYGRTIRREIAKRTGRKVSISAVYTTLDRLEQKGLLRSRLEDPTPQRGGRRKKSFQLEAAGARELKDAYRSYRNMVQGLEEQLESR
ncbi:MAG TPA: helix-turn-helix transcriptional regulator [Acidobacteriota bacterium]|nr:helix-turn-helix transcriptional regulator [Acidobacteriota bacterium]